MATPNGKKEERQAGNGIDDGDPYFADLSFLEYPAGDEADFKYEPESRLESANDPLPSPEECEMASMPRGML